MTEKDFESVSQVESQKFGKEMQLWQRILDRISAHFENNNFGDYVELLQNPKRLIFVNFLGGIARGIGIGLGFTFVAATLVWILQKLTRFNLPVVGDFIADIVKIVQAQLHTPTM